MCACVWLYIRMYVYTRTHTHTHIAATANMPARHPSRILSNNTGIMSNSSSTLSPRRARGTLKLRVSRSGTDAPSQSGWKRLCGRRSPGAVRLSACGKTYEIARDSSTPVCRLMW